MRKIFFGVFLLSISLQAFAQSGTNSPYSQYGLGTLSEQASGFNRGMNGLALGLREHNQVNMLNPASYSAIDSLSFIFDIGASGQVTNFKENGKRLNANNADLEYIEAGFRMFKHVGMSFGVVPFTNVGYSYYNTETINKDSYSTATSTNTYSGSGGLHQAYLGIGWQLFKGFSIGANASYLWGNIDRSLTNSYSDASVTTIYKNYTASIYNYKIDFGLQYTQKLNKNNNLTLGLTYGLGHKLGADPECMVISTPQTGDADTLNYKVSNGFELPTSFGAGFVWEHSNKLRVGVDYSLQKWSKVNYPEYTYVNGQPDYKVTEGLFNDRHKITTGAEYCPNEIGRKFFDRIRYRVGASYTSSYLKINGADGPKEYSVSAGFGIPIMNVWNGRSMLNISGQWVRSDSKDFIKENIFRINIGITFNERWFAKWKVD